MQYGPASLATLVIASTLSACAHVPPSGRASFRLNQYFATHGEILPSIRKAMQDGHVLIGMDAEQVRAVLGTPARRTTFATKRGFEVWIYQGYRLHQDQVHGDKAWLFRLVLIDGVLTIIEPI